MFLPAHILKKFKKKKHVSFSNETSVVLIPTKEEIADANLKESLWWTEDDFKKFKKDFLEEEFLNFSLSSPPSSPSKDSSSSSIASAS